MCSGEGLMGCGGDGWTGVGTDELVLGLAN